MDHPIYRNKKLKLPVRRVNGQLETGFSEKKFSWPPAGWGLLYSVQLSTSQRFYFVFTTPLTSNNPMKEGAGLIRNLVVRRGHNSGEIMVILVTSRPKIFSGAVNWALDRSIKSIMQNINDQPRQCGRNFGHSGQDFITDSMLGKAVPDCCASLLPSQYWDGRSCIRRPLTLLILRRRSCLMPASAPLVCRWRPESQQVYGVEVISRGRGKYSATQSSTVSPMPAMFAPLQKSHPKLAGSGIKADVILVDPPRKGKTAEGITSMSTWSHSGLSPSPVILLPWLRDIKLYPRLGYELKKVQPVDLAPADTYVETVALYELIKKQGV